MIWYHPIVVEMHEAQINLDLWRIQHFECEQDCQRRAGLDEDCTRTQTRIYEVPSTQYLMLTLFKLSSFNNST